MTATTREAATADAPALTASLGHPRYNRRLSDKILGAFNHAYAIVETETAARLRDILKDSEDMPADGESRDRGPLVQADRWTAFVDARNAYQDLAGRRGADAEMVDAALKSMRAAYLRWNDA